MKYIIKKAFTLIITLFIVSLLAFLAFAVIPGDPTTRILGTEATEEAVTEIKTVEDKVGWVTENGNTYYYENNSHFVSNGSSYALGFSLCFFARQIWSRQR